MIKKELLLLTLLLTVFPLVSAETWEASNSNGDAYASVRISSNSGLVPECDGETRVFFPSPTTNVLECKGAWYVDFNAQGDKFYIGYNVVDWSIEDQFGTSGTTYPFLFEIDDGRYYFDIENGVNIPKFVICAWDYDQGAGEQDPYWVWVSKCAGWTEQDMFSPFVAVDCFSGDKYCEGTSLMECEDGEWAFKGRFPYNGCGVECMRAEDCSTFNTGVPQEYCQDGNLVKDTISSVCNTDLTCGTSTTTDTLQNCDYDCKVIDGQAQCTSKPIPELEIGNTLFYLIPLSVIGLIVFIVWQRRKKPRRKK